MPTGLYDDLIADQKSTGLFDDLIPAAEPNEYEKAAKSKAETLALVRDARMTRMEALGLHPNLEAVTRGITEAMQEPVISPESATKAAAAVLSRIPVHRVPASPSKPGSIQRGIEEFVGENIAGLSTPTTAGAIALAPVAPEVMLPLFAKQSFEAIPEHVAQAVEGETPAEKIKGGLGTALDVAIASGTARGALKAPKIADIPLTDAEINRLSPLYGAKDLANLDVNPEQVNVPAAVLARQPWRQAGLPAPPPPIAPPAEPNVAPAGAGKVQPLAQMKTVKQRPLPELGDAVQFTLNDKPVNGVMVAIHHDLATEQNIPVIRTPQGDIQLPLREWQENGKIVPDPETAAKMRAQALRVQQVAEPGMPGRTRIAKPWETVPFVPAEPERFEPFTPRKPPEPPTEPPPSGRPSPEPPKTPPAPRGITIQLEQDEPKPVAPPPPKVAPSEFPPEPELPKKATPSGNIFKEFSAALDKWKGDVADWLKTKPENKAIVWKEPAREHGPGLVKALTRNIGDESNPWRITTYWERNGKFMPARHQVYKTRLDALAEDKPVKGSVFSEEIPGDVMTEKEISGWKDMAEVEDPSKLVWYKTKDTAANLTFKLRGNADMQKLVRDSFDNGRIAFTEAVDPATAKYLGLEPEKEKAAAIPAADKVPETPAKQSTTPAATTLREQKKYLVSELDKAIAEAPETAEGTRPLTEGDIPDQFRTDPVKGAAYIWEKNKETFGTVTIEVPGDGTFVLLNTKQALQDFKERAKSFPSTSSEWKPPGFARETPTQPAPIGKGDPKQTGQVLSDFVSTDPERKVLQYAFSDGKETVATDGRRMVIIPKGSGGTIKKPVAVTTSGKPVTLEEGLKIPGWKQVIPPIGEQSLWFKDLDTTRLFTIVRQAMETTSEKANSIRLMKNPDGSLAIESHDPDVGNYSHNVQEGAKVLAAVQPQYLLDAINAVRRMGNQTIDIYGKDELAPLTFKAKGIMSVLMPMRLSFAPPGMQAAIALTKASTQKLQSLRNKLVNSWATRGTKADIAQRKDAADNQAKVFANQAGKSVSLEAQKAFGAQAPQALRAAVAVIEAGGDRTKLAQFITQATGRNLEARQAAEFADANWTRLQPLADKIKTIHDAQIAEENANGIATEYRENYIKHAFDVEKLPNSGEEFFGSGGGVGTRSGFKAARKFETIYDAIEAGYGDAIKSLDAAKLTESRLASGQQLINDRQWVNAFRNVTDETTGKPIIGDVTFDRNHFPIAPPGYDAVTIVPGQFVAVHNGYRGIFDAVTGGSKIAGAEVGGLPVGQAVLGTAAGIKHGLLLFDTFHASRIMQKQFFLTGKVGWNKGLSLLQYADADLAEAVGQGEITQEMADYARTNRPKMILLTRNGLNVGRIQEALRSEVIRNLPVVGTFNKWVFDKVTRGAMMEAAIIELDRTASQLPNLTPQQVAAKVARNINVTFGNIGRQGLFKSRTMQDISRIVALAPQWVESMARSEIGGFKDLAKVPVDLAIGRGLQVGTLGKTMAGGLLSYLVGTQLLNLATRGQLTFQNKEEGHKMDAWIPDVTGKTPGYFLNPLSVVAELTHDAYRYAFKKENGLEVAKQMAENKASPLARSVGVLWSGKNYSGEKIDGTWNRIKESGSALVPAPIPVSGFASARPGQAQRQLTASMGIKTEPAPTALKQISDKGQQFTKAQGKTPEVDIVYHANSPHAALRNAIAKGDDKAAMEAIQTLRKTQTDAKIFQSWRASLTHPFTGSHALEAKFRQGLSPEDRQLYEQAKKEKQESFKRFQSLWAKRGR